MRFPLLASCLFLWLSADVVLSVDGKTTSPFYRPDGEVSDNIDQQPPQQHRRLEHTGPRRHNNRRSLVERDFARHLESPTTRSIGLDASERRLPRKLYGGTRSIGYDYAESYPHKDNDKYGDVSTNEKDYGDNGKHSTDDDYYYYGGGNGRGSSRDGDDDDDDDGGKGKGYSRSSRSYSRSSKSSKSSKSEKSEKSSKSSSGHSKLSPKPAPGTPPHPAPAPTHKPPGQKDYLRFVMVREEAGTPVPGYFGIGDSLALNGQVYYWKGVGDKVISDVPSGNFVALCTGVTTTDDLLCTYEIVLRVTKENKAASGVGVLVASGPSYYEENDMIVTGTEFDFAKYHGGTLVTVEDPVQPYLYATLYLI